VKVVLLRHGPAGDPDSKRWPDDHNRPLTIKGEKRVLKAAKLLSELVTPPTLIATSAALRAWRTATMVADSSGLPAPVIWPELLPEGAVAPVTARILAQASSETLLLVGHEPTLSEVAAQLLTGDPHGLRIKLSKAGIIGIDIRNVGVAEPRIELDFLISKAALD
jgi:phosphohistidine phosphatase